MHDGYRMSTNSATFCDKAISSLYYLIYRFSGDPQISRYVQTLDQQFGILKGFLGEVYDLDQCERMMRRPTNDKVATSYAEFDHLMFSSLRFTEADKRSIKGGIPKGASPCVA
jgi:hypothetical protein